MAGFSHEALVEIDTNCRDTLSLNRPHWNVVQGESADLQHFDGRPYKGIDLLAGGLPCPPFSVAGKQLGANDERNLFPDALRIVDVAVGQNGLFSHIIFTRMECIMTRVTATALG